MILEMVFDDPEREETCYNDLETLYNDLETLYNDLERKGTPDDVCEQEAGVHAPHPHLAARRRVTTLSSSVPI